MRSALRHPTGLIAPERLIALRKQAAAAGPTVVAVIPGVIRRGRHGNDDPEVEKKERREPEKAKRDETKEERKERRDREKEHIYPISGPTCTTLDRQALSCLVHLRDAKKIDFLARRNYLEADIRAARNALLAAGIEISDS